MHLLAARKSAIEITSRLDEANYLLIMGEERAHLGHWRVEGGTRKLFWSDEMYRIHGRAPEAGPPSLEAATDCYHSEDRSIVAALFEHTMRSGVGRTCEARLVQPGGTPRDVAVWAEARRGPGGAITGLSACSRTSPNARRSNASSAGCESRRSAPARRSPTSSPP